MGLGNGAEPGAGHLPALRHVAARLADRLSWTVLDLRTQAGPDAALAALCAQEHNQAGLWLAGLDTDVGLPLEEGHCWAEALGAWRQPVLLVVPAIQLKSGLPAAATALLRQWQVPLLGLLQWGGSWQARARRHDGLPWLGMLAEEASVEGSDGDELAADSAASLATVLALRWRQLDLA